MGKMEFIKNYWKSLTSPDAKKLKTFFHPDAAVFWHNTNELFTANEFIKVNCALLSQKEFRDRHRQRLPQKKGKFL